jgi:hypothetical protein
LALPVSKEPLLKGAYFPALDCLALEQLEQLMQAKYGNDAHVRLRHHETTS